MSQSIMLDKAKDFAVNVVNVCKDIKAMANEMHLLKVSNFWGAFHSTCFFYKKTASFEAVLSIY